MSYHNAWVSGCRRVGIAVFGSVVFMGALSLSACAGTYTMVDAETGTGSMIYSATSGSYDPTHSQWTFDLVASNTGTQTYNDVSLVAQFVWDTNGGTTPYTALTYTNSNNWAGNNDTFSFNVPLNCWFSCQTSSKQGFLGWKTGPFWLSDYTADHGNQQLSGTLFSFSGYQITSGPNMGSSGAPVPILVSDTNDPLSWGGNAMEALATVQSTDYCPAVPLGNFAPGASESFTVTCPANAFDPQVTGFFVVPVPEPSTFALLIAGGVGLLGCVWRRKRVA